MHEVTHILSAIEQGDLKAAEELLPLVYDELRKLAAEKMAQERPCQTLQATALVHEAYLRLVNAEKVQHWESRRHFFAAAAEAMRRILIENARRKACLKRGGDRCRVSLEKIDLATPTPPEQMLALDEAIQKLAAEDPAAAQLAKMLYLVGFPLKQAAAALGVSVATAYRHWAYARAWLHLELNRDE